MRKGLIGAVVAVGCAGIWSCAPSGGAGAASGNMGDIAPADEGAVGGISEVPNPSARMAAAVGKPLSRLQRGHEIYMLKCGECHQYMLPQEVDLEDWEDVMPQMIRHAGLPREDEDAVLDYVIGVKKQNG